MTTEIVQVPSRSYELMPVVSTQANLARRRAISEIMQEVMREGVHYGTIPGTERKNERGEKISNPTLLKPGAELMCTTFGLCPVFKLESDAEDWTGELHGGEPFFAVVYRCELWRGDWMVATASGAANSWEKKHRWRSADRACPECNSPTILKSNQDQQWFCWKKKGGCGATFPLNDVRITGQKQGNVPNPDFADLQNTIIKMAQKRALVAAVLIATGCSDTFTQDLEDLADDAHAAPPSDGPRGRNASAPVAPTQEPTAPRPPTAAQLKRQEFERLVACEGFIPDTKDKAAVAEFIGMLLGRVVTQSEAQTLTADDLKTAREELEARNRERKRFYAIKAESPSAAGWTDDSERDFIAVAISHGITSRSHVTSEEWHKAAELLKKGAETPEAAAAPRIDEDDPFADE